MKITFQRKNKTVLDRTFNIDEGSTITENYNETLDSATIRISHLIEPLDIEPFDKVILFDEEGRLPYKYMLVDTYTETMESLDPVSYSYEISLFSRTKELENYILPSMSITQSNTDRSVWYYLRQYINNAYTSNRVWMRHQNGYFVAKYSFSTSTDYDFENKFATKCPEMQWNNPTLREVLTSLMMVCDCIPIVLDNNKIGYIDLTKTYNEVKKPLPAIQHINYVQGSQSSEDYVSELRMDMQNVMQTTLTGVKQTVSKIEYMTLRPEDGSYVVTEENMCLKTEYPILRIKHLWLTYQTLGKRKSGDDAIQYWLMRKYDLCNLQLKSGGTVNIIYEKQEYDSLPAQRYNATDFNQIGQANSIYFTRGDNKVTGFSTFYKYDWFSEQNKLYTLKKLLQNYAISEIGLLQRDYEKNAKDMAVNRWFSTFFTIEYETTADAVFQASKDLAPTHERVVADNQTYSFVDAYNQGMMEYQKANRLGNKQLFINARFENDYDNIIKIGDTYDTDNVVFQTQYQIYKNHIEVNATATKNFILRDYFTGVKAKIRSWKIADAGESFISHKLVKYYLEFSKKVKNEYFGTTVPYAALPITGYFLSPLTTSYIRPLKYCFVKTTDEHNSNRPGSGEYYTLELIGRIFGNSIVFTFGFPDNYNVGEVAGYDMKVGDKSDVWTSGDIRASDWRDTYASVFDVRTSYIDNYGGIPLSNAPYTDDNGEMLHLAYHFSYEAYFPYFPKDVYTTSNNKHYLVENDQEATDEDHFNENIFMYYTTKYPWCYSYTYFIDSQKVANDLNFIFKDNREILKVSTQFELCSDTHDIVFTKNFLKLQECLREAISSGPLQSPTVSFNWGDYTSSPTIGTVDVQTTTPILNPLPTYYYYPYNITVESLLGVPATNVSETISATTVSGRTNSVQYMGNGLFTGTIYGEDRTSVEATITYQLNWNTYTATKTINIADTINRDVTIVNVNIPYILRNHGAKVTVIHDKSTGDFTITVIFDNGESPILLGSQDISFTYVFVNETTFINQMFVLTSATSDFDWRNPSLDHATIDNDAYVVVDNISNTNSSIEIKNAAAGRAYYIVNKSNELLLAFKGTRKIYLNCLLSRDYNVYDSNGNVVGSID